MYVNITTYFPIMSRNYIHLNFKNTGNFPSAGNCPTLAKVPENFLHFGWKVPEIVLYLESARKFPILENARILKMPIHFGYTS